MTLNIEKSRHFAQVADSTSCGYTGYIPQHIVVFLSEQRKTYETNIETNRKKEGDCNAEEIKESHHDAFHHPLGPKAERSKGEV